MKRRIKSAFVGGYLVVREQIDDERAVEWSFIPCVGVRVGKRERVTDWLLLDYEEKHRCNLGHEHNIVSRTAPIHRMPKIPKPIDDAMKRLAKRRKWV